MSEDQQNNESGMTPEEEAIAWEKEDKDKRKRRLRISEAVEELRGISGFQSDI